MITALLLAATLAPGAQKLQRDAEDRARVEVNDLLKTLCPEQCVLLSVEAKLDEEELDTPVTPGFDSTATRSVPVVRSLSTSLLVDERLPPAFRGRVRTLVAQRLKGAGVPVNIGIEQVPFPPRTPPQDAQPQPPPQPAVQAAGLSPQAAPTVIERLEEHAPMLAVVSLLALVLVVLGALLVIALRRQDAAYVEPVAADAPAETPQASSAPAPSAETLSPERIARLEKQVVEQRGARNAVLRDALGRGESELVAIWLRELGEGILDDLRGESSLAAALSAVARELLKPASDVRRAVAVHELESRLLAARLARTSETDPFAFLDGARADAFVAAVHGLSAAGQEVALRFAPQHLRAAALRSLAPARRDELAVAWAKKPEVSASYARAVADELRQKVADVTGGPGHTERAMHDLLDLLSRAEQDALLDRLRNEGVHATMWTESALARCPAEVLANVLLSVPAKTTVDYLSGADEGTRLHVLSATPARLRKEIEEELGLRPGTDPQAFRAARRELLARVREEMQHRGDTPLEPRAARARVVPLS